MKKAFKYSALAVFVTAIVIPGLGAKEFEKSVETESWMMIQGGFRMSFESLDPGGGMTTDSYSSLVFGMTGYSFHDRKLFGHFSDLSLFIDVIGEPYGGSQIAGPRFATGGAFRYPFSDRFTIYTGLGPLVELRFEPESWSFGATFDLGLKFDTADQKVFIAAGTKLDFIIAQLRGGSWTSSYFQFGVQPYVVFGVNLYAVTDIKGKVGKPE